jgi:hypothetical protein
MKLGFYVDTNGGTPQNTEIYNFLNREVAAQNLDDAAVFFNTINFNPVTPKFGMFDATELWHFTGNLITTSVINTVKARNVVNRFKLAYLFKSADMNEQTVFELSRIATEMKVMVSNELDEKEFHRLTGTKPVLLDGFSLEKISEVFNEGI